MLQCVRLAGLVVTAILALPLSSLAQQPPPEEPPPAQCMCSGPMVLKTSTARQIEIDWCGSIADAGTLLETGPRVPNVRIDERSAPRVRIRNFNYLHYAPTIETEGTVIETYVALDKLWKQVFAVLGGVAGGLKVLAGPCKGLEDCLGRWILEASDINLALDEALRTTTDVAVSPGDLGTLKQLASQISEQTTCAPSDRPTLVCAVKRLEDAQAAARAAAREPGEGDLKLTERMASMANDQVKLLDRLAAFRQGVAAIETGKVKSIKKYKAGTIVAVTVTPVPQTPIAPASDGATFEYLVHSKFPLTYHLGYAGSGLKQFEFEKVRALDDRDLFQEVRKSDSVAGMAAFMSYELPFSRGDEPAVTVLATLGTDFTKPGERIYMGGSLRAARLPKFYLTVGAVTATVTEGTNAIVEQLGGALGSRELFKTLSSRRDWTMFIGLSAALF